MIEHVHLTPEIFEACKRGEISEAQLYRLVGEATYCACDGCSDKLQPWRRPYHQLPPPQPTLADVFQLITPPTRKERKEAKRDFKKLMKLPAEHRARKIRRAVTHYRDPVLAELLLKACVERIPVDAQDAYHLAELAQAVLNRCVASARVEDLRVLCLAHLATASKAQGDLDTSEQQFRAARYLLCRLPAPHPHVQADLAWMEGSYRKDRRQLGRSASLLSEAISLYELLGDSLQTAQARLVLGACYFHSGEPEQAVETTEKALLQLDLKRHPRLHLSARHNLTLYLCESDRVVQAARQLKTDWPIYELMKAEIPHLDLRFHWLAGKIQRRLDNPRRAEQHLVQARDGFAEYGTSYDAILVCLDLALVYATQKRHAKLSELADLMVSGFAAQGLHDEALAAVSLAAEAARERRLTEDVVRKIAHFLQFARHDPSLKRDF